ncbi:MAG: UDP-N-acetylmuramoyl-tripeptide--D-alanyl-D-alanine ligase [Lachnospiraceae bacterium]|nr:UDP-N-acetylmuramoyl-tripeptide--D-alanyl-D-alanine ligase [Lachnospiraceae bacterium]
MRHFTIQQFTESCGGTFYGPTELLEKEIQGVVVDSRLIQKDYLFVATVGERVDGHRFIPDVYEKGAICALSQQKLENPAGPYILVENTFQALKDAAEAYRKTLDIPVIGITGSVGKTSTKEMIATILEQKYNVLKTPGNFNNEIGLPLTLFMIDTCHEVAVLEMGMNHFGEMHRLSKMARPDICVLTNIGVAHLEFLGSRDGILKAKSEIFDYAADDVKVFVNGDDDKLITLKDRAVTFGLDASHPVWSDQTEHLGLEGMHCRIHISGHSIPVSIPLPGSHMIYNAMAGACVADALGLSPEQIQAGIESLKPISGRSNIIHASRYILLDDCYNANPVSMCAMLDVLEHSRTRKVAILGDMGELGEEEKTLHSSVGEHLKDLHIDLVITIGPLSEAIHNTGLLSAPQTQFLHFSEKEQFLIEAKNILQHKDSILIKASHYMGFEHIVETLKEHM